MLCLYIGAFALFVLYFLNQNEKISKIALNVVSAAVFINACLVVLRASFFKGVAFYKGF